MTFTILAIRTGEEPASQLYPDPGEVPNSIELSAADGRATVYTATALAVVSLAGSRPQQLCRFGDITAAVIVTDARLAVARHRECRQQDPR